MSILLAVILTAGASAAEPPADSENALICRRIIEIGSRLQGKRICKTKAQWDEQRRIDRMAIEQSQTRRGTADGN